MGNVSDMIKKELIELICLKVYQADDELPSIREQATHYHVNPNTISKVYRQLESEGFIYSVQATGYYVAKSNDALMTTLNTTITKAIKVVCLYGRHAGYGKDQLVQLLETEVENND